MKKFHTSEKNKNRTQSILLLVLILIAVPLSNLKAQTITTTESRCVNTGTVEISGTVGAGGPYQVSITSAPAQYINPGAHLITNLPDTIEALYPGAYTLRVVDKNGVPFNSPFTITGNYTLPGNNDYLPTTTGSTSCLSPNGKIQGTMSNGRAPYSYSILSGPAQVGATNSTGTFNNLPAGNYQVQAADSCQNIQTRNVTVVNSVNEFAFVGQPVINRIGCDSFSLVSLNVSPAFPTGGYYKIVAYEHNGGTPKVYTSTTLPLNFSTYGNDDIKDMWVHVIVFDACGNGKTIEPRTIANDWDFTAANITVTCGAGVVLNSVSTTGTITAPYTITIKPYDPTAGPGTGYTGDQSVIGFPYTISGVDANTVLLNTITTITDACGNSKSVINEMTFGIRHWSSSNFNSCNSSIINLIPEGVYTNPVTYYASRGDTITVASNTNGSFTLPDGSYRFIAIDACGKETSTGIINIDHEWKLQAVAPWMYCEVGKISHSIGVPIRSFGAVVYTQYDGAKPITASSVVLSIQTYTGNANGMPSISADDADPWLDFHGTLPNHTYTYVAVDACGKTDTVSITNGANGRQPMYHVTTVKNKCSNKSDIYSSWDSDMPGWSYAVIKIWDINNSATTLNELYTVHDGIDVMLLSDADPGTYVVQYSMNACDPDSLGYDTVIVSPYQQPTVLTAQSFVPCAGGGSPVALTGSKGVGPYTYEIVNSTPHHYTAPAQTGSIFILPSSESSVTVRIVDACLNSSTKTVAVAKASNPVIQTSPSKISACNFPVSFNIYTDSLYEGSLYAWKKISGTGSGNTVLGTSPSLPVTLHSITDTGTYQVRITVPGTCYDVTKNFALVITPCVCTPTSATQNKTICSGGSYTIGTHTYSVAGTYTDTLVNNIGCDSVVTTNLSINTSCSALSTIGNKVWQDTDGDGVQDVGEPGIAGVTVTIYDAFGVAVASTVSSATGAYQFTNIPAGTYYMHVTLPATYNYTSSTGTDLDNGTNSDVNQASGYTDPFVISEGITELDIDAGLTKLTLLATAGITAKAVLQGNTTTVSWNVKVETNVNHYEIERSIDNYNFSKTGSNLNASVNNGTSVNYTVADDVSRIDNAYLIYYRIKSVSKDGKISYSNIVFIRIDNATQFTVWPTPVKDKAHVSFKASTNGIVQIRIMDIKGKQLQQNSFKVIKGNNQFTINGMDKYAKGIYLLEINNNNETKVVRLVKD